MTDEFEFFSNDCNSWNYNPFINTPNADPQNKKSVIKISSNNNYNLMKYNAVIMLKEILKHIERESLEESAQIDEIRELTKASGCTFQG